MALLAVIMVFAVAVFSYASTFPGASHFRSGNWIPGPSFFPQILAAVLFTAAAIELVRAVRKRAAPPADPASGNEDTAATNDAPADGAPASDGEAAAGGSKTFAEWISDWGTQNAIIIIGLMLMFPFLMERVGFAILGFATLFIITWRLKAGLATSLVFSAVSVILTILFFRYIFYMDLPYGIWSPSQYLG